MTSQDTNALDQRPNDPADEHSAPPLTARAEPANTGTIQDPADDDESEARGRHLKIVAASDISDDGAADDLPSETEGVPDVVLTSKDERNFEATPLVDEDIEATLTTWRVRIEGFWRKTVQEIIEIGRQLMEARNVLGKSYRRLVDELPFSQSTAANFVAVAEHPILSDPNYGDRLPMSLTTLYYLSQLSEAEVVAGIENGLITPTLTVAGAKMLTQGVTDGGRTAATESDYIDVVVSVPKSADRSQVLKDAQKFAHHFGGSIHYRKNEKSVGDLWREAALRRAEEGIASTQNRLPSIIDYGKMCWLDEGPAEALIEERARLRLANQEDENVNKRRTLDPRLPEDYPELEELKTLTGLQEITFNAFKKWCLKHDVPTRLALTSVTQPAYVWEQVRQVATKENDKAALKRLERVAKGKSREMTRLALDALDMLDNFDSFEPKRNVESSDQAT